MHISDSTTNLLVNIITGDDSALAPYRTFSNIINFFNSLGIKNPEGPSSRGPYVRYVLEKLNDSPNLDKVILGAFDPRHFLKESEESRNEIESTVEYFNKFLLYDGFQLVKVGLIYKLKEVNIKVPNSNNEKIKNIIFASSGPKPELVLIDAANNDIRITKNAEYCLIYDKPIPNEGLKWTELVSWWSEQQPVKNLTIIEHERNLYRRLSQSIQSPPEKLLFNSYYKIFRALLGDKLLALLPQVYLHYDPYTISQLAGNKRLQRQRMDFLLLTEEKRIVIEVDGIQHYSASNANGIAVAEPKIYADMVNEDRRLKLAGYELFRFGGYELQKEDEVDNIAKDFFSRLFKL